MPSLVILQFAPNESITIYSIAVLFGTGKAPGRPKHVGQTLILGSSVSTTLHEQNIFDFVSSST